MDNLSYTEEITAHLLGAGENFLKIIEKLQEKNLIEIDHVPFFCNLLINNIKTKKEKHSRYEVRFFWPSPFEPEVYDLQGLIFNEKDFSHTLTTDQYMVTQSHHNIKIRKNEWQVKEYLGHIDSIFHFKKKKTLKFPLNNQKIEKILQQELGTMVFETPEDLLQKLSTFSGISRIEVLKERMVRKLADHTKIEISRIKIQGKEWKTICIESKNLENVLALSLLINPKNAEKLSYNAFLQKNGLSLHKAK